MAGNPKLTTHDSQIDQLSAELLSAVRVSEDEVAATASSSAAYDRLRLRIAEIGARAKQRRSAYHRLRNVAVSFLSVPRLVVLSSAAAIIVALVLGLVALLSGPSSSESAQPQPLVQASESSLPDKAEPPRTEGGRNATTVALADRPVRTPHKRARLENRSSEIATDFLPLTYVDDLSAQQSGHIVRMKVPRSALIAFGVPMNMERAGELITADVMIGDDGLARAIRFVQ